MLKKEIRKKYKDFRATLTNEEIEEKSLAIANQLLSLNIWDKNYYHLFLTIEELKEINTEYILQILAGKDKDIVVSKCDFENRDLINFLLTDNTKFKKNNFNVFEPIDGIEVPHNKIDVVFIPLLAYDKKGNRVGYGKGFYDNFLSQCRGDVLKIGISFFHPEEIIEDVTENDIRLDYCVMPDGINSFE